MFDRELEDWAVRAVVEAAAHPDDVRAVAEVCGAGELRSQAVEDSRKFGAVDEGSRRALRCWYHEVPSTREFTGG